jgi:hypothetical protein
MTNPDELVERLRRNCKNPAGKRKPSPRELEAADRITSLQDRIAQLEEAGEAAYREGWSDGNAAGYHNLTARRTQNEDWADSGARRFFTNWRAAQESKS